MSVLTLLTIFAINFLLTFVSPIDKNDPSQLNDWSAREINIRSSVSKRQSGSDPWSVCPDTMESVDCFYVYLRIYARIRKEAENRTRDYGRNIGKR